MGIIWIYIYIYAALQLFAYFVLSGSLSLISRIAGNAVFRLSNASQFGPVPKAHGNELCAQENTSNFSQSVLLVIPTLNTFNDFRALFLNLLKPTIYM